MTTYSVAFESIDFATSIEAESPIDAAKQGVIQIPDWQAHKRHGGIEVVSPDGTARWFQPTTQLVELDESDEPILEHDCLVSLDSHTQE